jgi:tRNA/rRNA methyltransferase
MQAMGFRQLWIVDPEDPKIASRSDAVALSSGAAQVLGDARLCSLDEALAQTTWSCAMSARVREFEPPRLSLEDACDLLLDHLTQDPERQAAFVFGAERSGLTNDQLLACRHVCSLDVDEKFSSLNLSQAVQVVAYAMRRAGRTRATDGPNTAMGQGGNNRESAKPATHEAVKGLHDHLVRVAIQSGYLDPANPGRFEDRLKRLLARKEMWEDEVQMLRGLCTEIERRT